MSTFLDIENLNLEAERVKIKAYSSRSELFHTGRVEEVAKKALKDVEKKAIDVERFKRLEGRFKEIGWDELNFEGFRRLEALGDFNLETDPAFVGFAELEAGKQDKDGLRALEDGGEDDNVNGGGLEAIGEKDEAKKSKNQFFGSSKIIVENHQKLNSEPNLEDHGASLNEIEPESTLQRTEITPIDQNLPENTKNSKTKNRQKKEQNLRLYIQKNRCEVLLDIAHPTAIQKHGFKQEIGWGSINEALISSVLYDTGLVDQWLQEVSKIHKACLNAFDRGQ